MRRRAPEPQIRRPLPPPQMVEDGRHAERFAPAPDVAEWIRTMILADDGPLFNPEHSHLLEARIGVLWTTAENTRQMRSIAGTAEIPDIKGARWGKAKERFWLREWFEEIPDLVITLDAVYCASMPDVSWCALVEHELYHCVQKLDHEGEPQTDIDGNPVFTIRGHDVEEFVGVVERYGMVGANVRRLVEAAQRQPSVAPGEISMACGTCLRMVA